MNKNARHCRFALQRTIITALLFMAAITTNAQFIFRISGNGLEKPSYILGTLHVMSGDLLDSIPAYLEAESQCLQLFVETDTSAPQYRNDIKATSQQLITLPDGKTITDILGEEKMNVLQERMKKSCHVDLADSAAQTILHYQPFFFAIMLNSVIQMEALQKYPAMRNGNMIDGACAKRAKDRGWKVGNLDQKLSSEELAKEKETLNQSIDEQADSLMALLNNFDERRQKILKEFEGIQTLGDYWTAGDYEGFERLFLPENEANPALYGERNKKWMPTIIEAMKEKPTLFVFGAGHLTGPIGVVQMLREAGYQVADLSR